MDRNYILAEIRRTAAENGGRALGRQRFFAETGIREHEWTRYWPRWSDAVREAGLEPVNRFQSAIPEHTLLDKLAMFVRETGRFPVFRELKVRARTDADFPSPETFRRMGGMGALARRLKAFAAERGYNDVAALCVVQEKPVAVVLQGRTKPVEMGSVYLIKSGRFFKIGHTNAVGRRERELAIQLPERVRVIHEIRTDDPLGIEDYWHRRFAARRGNGEWFNLTAEDVAAFRRRKTM